MEKEIKNLKSHELNQLYLAVKEFISYLEKQYKETESIGGKE